MDYNCDIDDERYLWADEILSWIEDEHLLELEAEEEELIDIE
jgi:hypothetical protein